MNILYTLIISLSFHAYLILCIPQKLSFTPPFTIIGLANKTTFFIHDRLHNNFILKYHPRGPKRAIHDTLGAYIGKSIGIHINEVEIFSASHSFNESFNAINPLNPSQIGITTLHSHVPGTAVREIKYMDEEICIKCGIRKEKTLDNIAKYIQLSDIIAFDIFIDNTDRHNGNIFFDKQTKQFYAIDMDHGFKSAFALVYTIYDYDFNTVATRTYNFLKTVKKRSLSEQKVKALKQLQKTLQLLIDLYPPELLFEEWMELAKKAEIIYNPREQEKIRKYLEYNILEVIRLIKLLNKIT